MTAVERIQAAIEKLTKLKADSTPGIGTEWWVDDCDVHIDGVGNLGRESWSGVKETAELIVTLHRTIDAQLMILQLALGDARGSDFCWQFSIPLANAILGADS